MERIKIDLNSYTPRETEEIVGRLRRGQVMVYPTDTIYGLGGDAVNVRVIRKIFRIKKRQPARPLLVLVSSIGMLKRYCYLGERERQYLKKIWPGPVSAVLRHKAQLPSELTGGLDTLGARLPRNDFLATIIKRLGRPLISTSLNVAGAPPADPAAVDWGRLGEKPDFIVDGGILRRRRPSRLVDLSRPQGRPSILRR